MKVCKSLCDACPFSRTSMPGFLADYKVTDFQNFIRFDFPFPCHKLIHGDMSSNEVRELIEREELLLCRGYVESMVKSAKLPKDPEFASIVKNINIGSNSMSIFEFIKFHSKE
jgi:hypothetical protein